MDKARRSALKLSGLAAAALTLGACGKSDDSPSPSSTLGVSFWPERMVVAYDAASVAVYFDQPIDGDTLEGRFHLSDLNGPVDIIDEVIVDPQEVTHKRVLIVLKTGMELTPSWKYYLTIVPGVASTNRASPASTATSTTSTTPRPR